jgi:hypothetical protein
MAFAIIVAGLAASAAAQSGRPQDGPRPLQELDAREANVTAVSFEMLDEGRYRFDVALFHDDTGEEGYANWWQVETLGGELLGRRELLHAHSRQPFTRSETINIPDGTNRLVIRGHDQTHEYGGQAAILNLSSGELLWYEQGPEPMDFSGE